VAPSLIGGTPFRSPGPHTLPVGKAARAISARHALQTESILGQNYVTAQYRQAKLYSRNLLNIATGPGFRQHAPRGETSPKVHGISPVNPTQALSMPDRRAKPAATGAFSSFFSRLERGSIAVMLKKSPQESTLNSLLILCPLKHLSSCRE